MREPLFPAGGAAELVQKHTNNACTAIVVMDSTVIPSQIFQVIILCTVHVWLENTNEGCGLMKFHKSILQLSIN